MRYRLFLFLVTAFFVTMNVLLWRSEFGGRGHMGSPVPLEVVWEKILTCPDNSFLEIRHKGFKLGRAHWSASVGEEQGTARITTDELPPEGMIKQLSGYRLDFDGNVAIDALSRLRFTSKLSLDTNQNWQEFVLTLTLKPFTWQVRASEVLQNVTLTSEDDEGHSDRVFTFSQLRNPEKLLGEVGGAALPAALTAFGVRWPAQTPGRTNNNMALGLEWQARNDWLTIGSNPVRVYRLEARLFDRYRAVLFVSPVGEILRVELPDEIVLMNDALTNL
jgi:hypothetical protein